MVAHPDHDHTQRAATRHTAAPGAARPLAVPGAHHAPLAYRRKRAAVAPPLSLLLAGASTRLTVSGGLIAALWAATLWALG